MYVKNTPVIKLSCVMPSIFEVFILVDDQADIITQSQSKVEASVVQWLCHSPCKPGSIPGFSSLLDGTINPSPYELSCW